ncbi:MAG: MMPL family transporter [Deltaproteobacteria bacterium]|nr:MMPL family transporter [Deltaproteobacteria bacterium]
MITLLMRYIAKLPLAFPKTIIAIALVLTLLAAAMLPKLHVSTDRNLLSGKENASFRHREEVNDLFGTSLVAAVVITGKDDRQETRKVADEVANALSQHKDTIRDVFYKADLSFFKRHALLFLPVEKVAKLPEILEQTSQAIDMVAQAEGLPDLVTGLAEVIEDSPAPTETNDKQTQATLAFFGDIFDDFGAWFKNEKKTELTIGDKIWSIGPSMNSRPGDDGYLTDNDGKSPPIAVLFVQPVSNSQAMEVVAPLTDLIRDEVSAVLAGYPGVSARVTGMPAIVTDEMRLVQRDCVVAGLVSGIGVLLVFMLAFRSLRVSLFLVLPLGVGLIWSAGLTAVLFGHLTLITSYFAAVLFGIGVAFTIHIVARFHEALLAGKQKQEAITIALTQAGPGVVAGGGTTALAFLAIAFSEFKGFAEMGVISGLGVTLILLTNLTLLPAALILWHPGKRVVQEQKGGGAIWVDIARSRIIVPLLAFGAMVAGAVLSLYIGFDYAVENMLPGRAESVMGMRTLEDRTDFSMNYSIALADSLEGADDLRRRFSDLSTVSRAESLSMFLPSNQKRRVAALKEMDDKVRDPIERAAMAVASKSRSLGDATTAKSLSDALETFADTLEDLAFDAKRAGRTEANYLPGLVKKVRAAQETVLKSGDNERARQLEQVIFDGLSLGLGVLKSAIGDTGFEIDDLPLAVRSRYLSPDGKHYAVIIFPNGDIADRAFFEKHVEEILSVSEETTGHPVTHLEFTRMVHEGFKDAVVLAAIAVVLLILLDLRTGRGLALGLLPVLMGLGWTSLIMAATGFKFNYANLMALPILIGTGVDYGVHLAHRANQEGSIRAAARTTGRAIALTGLTTLIGFGSLLLGNHWGVRSLGLILVIGITASLTAALIVIPGIVRPRSEPR